MLEFPIPGTENYYLCFLLNGSLLICPLTIVTEAPHLVATARQLKYHLLWVASMMSSLPAFTMHCVTENMLIHFINSKRDVRKLKSWQNWLISVPFTRFLLMPLGQTRTHTNFLDKRKIRNHVHAWFIINLNITSYVLLICSYKARYYIA